MITAFAICTNAIPQAVDVLPANTMTHHQRPDYADLRRGSQTVDPSSFVNVESPLTRWWSIQWKGPDKAHDVRPNLGPWS